MLCHEVTRLNKEFDRVKRGPLFFIQMPMKIFERYEWSRIAEEEVILHNIIYDGLYTKLSGATVIWENEVKRSGRDPDTVDDRRMF